MNYLHAPFVAVDGNVVEVTLHGTAANVMLLDDNAFANYRAGRAFQYTGGHSTRSPVTIAVPSAGRWNLVIDLGGRPGTVSATYQLR